MSVWRSGDTIGKVQANGPQHVWKAVRESSDEEAVSRNMPLHWGSNILLCLRSWDSQGANLTQGQCASLMVQVGEDLYQCATLSEK